jgi:HPt (histidine-containing phosphotransfer) domain-containing protein
VTGAAPAQLAGNRVDPSSEIDYDARLAALAAAFAQGLADKRAAVARAWQAWRAGDAAARDELRTLAHRLGGAADNYGYIALGEAARALDALLIPRLATPAVAAAAAVAALLDAFGLPPAAI